MNFDIFNINKELELLNKKINSNNIVDNNYSNNVIKIEEKKELEFIITEINSDISKTFESELKELQGYVNVLVSQTLYTGRMNDIRNNYVKKHCRGVLQNSAA